MMPYPHEELPKPCMVKFKLKIEIFAVSKLKIVLLIYRHNKIKGLNLFTSLDTEKIGRIKSNPSTSLKK